MRRFFEAFEGRCWKGKVSFRRLLREEVSKFASFLEDGTDPGTIWLRSSGGPGVKWLVCYDVADDLRRAHLNRVLLDYGLRIQESVFWVDAEEDLIARMRQRLAVVVSIQEDSLWMVPVCNTCAWQDRSHRRQPRPRAARVLRRVANAIHRSSRPPGV